jgi:hypothetical protein
VKRVLLAVALTACAGRGAAPMLTSWSLADLGQGPLHANGVGVNLSTGHLWLLAPSVGLVETTPTGTWVKTIPFDTQFTNRGFTDITVLEDGSFVLPSNGEGWKYDPVHGVQPFFCLEPPLQGYTLEEQAVTLDPTTGSIWVAPVMYKNGFGAARTVVSAHLTRYSSSDGTYQSDTDVMPSGVIAEGLAVDPSTKRAWAVEHDRLDELDASGALVTSTPLEGVTEAAGLSLDDDEMYVLDGADDTVHVYSRSTLPR